jgi:hypothetical protein
VARVESEEPGGADRASVDAREQVARGLVEAVLLDVERHVLLVDEDRLADPPARGAFGFGLGSLDECRFRRHRYPRFTRPGGARKAWPARMADASSRFP